MPPVLGHANAPIVIPDEGSAQPQQIPTLSQNSTCTAQQPQWPSHSAPHPAGPRMPPFSHGMPPWGAPVGMAGPHPGYPGPFPPYPRQTGAPPPWMPRTPAPSSASVPPPEECYTDVTDEMIEVYLMSLYGRILRKN